MVPRLHPQRTTTSSSTSHDTHVILSAAHDEPEGMTGGSRARGVGGVVDSV